MCGIACIAAVAGSGFSLPTSRKVIMRGDPILAQIFILKWLKLLLGAGALLILVSVIKK